MTGVFSGRVGEGGHCTMAVGDLAVVIDAGDGVPVTMDDDRVVADVLDLWCPSVPRRIVYRDSCGVWAELMVRDGFSVGPRDRGPVRQFAAIMAIVAEPDITILLDPEPATAAEAPGRVRAA